MTPAQRSNLTRLLSPRHIAFIGGRDAEVAIQEAKRAGYAGHIWPVNPKRETLGGFRCFASVADLPEAPDGVFLAVPAPAAVETTAQLAARGSGGIVCYTAGFREAGEEGLALETALIKAAGDMALVGPNCYGVINYLDRAALWPFAHGGGSPGYGAAIITQSGMLSSDITMSQRSVPVTHMISCGNQSVLRLEDFVDHLSEHPAVRAIGLHIEGLRNVADFAAAALKAATRGVPLVALKTGASQIGASLTVSHTGSLSGADDLYNALFDRVGVISRGELLLVEEKNSLMRRFGKREMRVELMQPLAAIPASLARYNLVYLPEEQKLVYAYEANGERTGITALFADLAKEGIILRDVETRESSLEEIFVGLVKENA